jgi:hypothetical protein
MSVRFIIHNAEELIGLLESKAAEARANQGKTRTKVESNELRGQVYAFNESIFYIKEMVKTQKEDATDQENGLEPLKA